MITREIAKNLTLLTAEQRSIISMLLDKDEATTFNREWMYARDTIVINKQMFPDIAGRTDFWLANITSDAIMKTVSVYKNGLLLNSPFPSGGYPWIKHLEYFDYSIELLSVEKFIPPLEVHFILNYPLVETDYVTVMIDYMSYIPANYNYADAVTDLYLKRTRDEAYLDRDYHLFTEVVPQPTN